MKIAVIRSPWLNKQLGQGTQVETLLSGWFGSPHITIIEFPNEGPSSNTNDAFVGLLDEDGAPAFSVLVCPGGNDQRMWASIAHPQIARDRVREFVARGGGFVGLCAGMCLASQGYWDIEGRLSTEKTERQKQFQYFPAIFPAELQNLHRLRRTTLNWNSSLATTHPMYLALPLTGSLVGARFNDGNIVTEPPPLGTELLLRCTRDEPWNSTKNDDGSDSISGASNFDPITHGSLEGDWVSIAYIDPHNPTAGRLCLDGWHPESIHTPHCHAWLRAEVEYAANRYDEVRAAAV